MAEADCSRRLLYAFTTALTSCPLSRTPLTFSDTVALTMAAMLVRTQKGRRSKLLPPALRTVTARTDAAATARTRHRARAKTHDLCIPMLLGC